MNTEQNRLYGEPSIEEILNDPIMKVLLRGDGLDLADVRRAMDVATARLERRCEA